MNKTKFAYFLSKVLSSLPADTPEYSIDQAVLATTDTSDIGVSVRMANGAGFMISINNPSDLVPAAPGYTSIVFTAGQMVTVSFENEYSAIGVVVSYEHAGLHNGVNAVYRVRMVSGRRGNGQPVNIGKILTVRASLVTSYLSQSMPDLVVGQDVLIRMPRGDEHRAEYLSCLSRDPVEDSLYLVRMITGPDVGENRNFLRHSIKVVSPHAYPKNQPVSVKSANGKFYMGLVSSYQPIKSGIGPHYLVRMTTGPEAGTVGCYLAEHVSTRF